MTHWFQTAQAAIDQQRLVDTLRELISIPSLNPFDAVAGPGEGEQDVAAYMLERLERLGFATSRRKLAPRRVNVLATFGDGPPERALMLAGHMDTVRTTGYSDAFDAQVRDGRVHGRGACDMKGALACYLEVAEALVAAGVPLRGRLVIAGVADEEFGMTGARDIGSEGPRVGAAIMGEPTEMAVCPAARGRVSTFVITRGRAAHTSAPEAGVNAVVHMAHVIRRLEGYAEDLRERGARHALLGTPRFSPSVIAGGVQVNMVPDECRLEVDRRTLPGETAESVRAELEGLLGEVATDLPALEWEVTEPSWYVPPHEVESDHPLVAALQRGMAAVGAAAEVRGFPGGSDAPYLGSPTVICGPGSLAQAHTTDEWVAIDQLMLASRVYLHTAIEVLTA